MINVVGVLLPLPFNDVFDYKTEKDVSLGQIVRVPFLNNTQVGVVYKLGKSSTLEDKKIKNILEVLNLPHLKKELLQFIDWVAKYNLANLGMVLKMVLCAKGVFEDAKHDVLYKLTGKTLAEAKLKNSDARWHVIDLLKHAPYSKSEILTIPAESTFASIFCFCNVSCKALVALFLAKSCSTKSLWLVRYV